MSKEREWARGVDALCRVNRYPELYESTENRAYVISVLFHTRGRDEHVVDVREDKIETGENRIH